MTSPYISDILEQPAALQRTLDGLVNSASLANLIQKWNNDRVHRILLTGMGSSYHVLYPLFLRLVEHGIPVQMLETSELIHYAQALIAPDSLIVAVSQSGQSVEMVRLLDLAEGIAPVIGVTNTVDSPLGTRAAVRVPTQAGEEFSVSCKTYISALAALSWLGDVLIGQSEEFPRLADAPRLVAEYLHGWQAYVAELEECFKDIRHLFLVGRGPSLAAAETGGLIIKEAARFPAQGLSSAAFRHGPFEVVSPQVFVLVYVGDARTAALNEQMVSDVRSAGGRVGAVAPAAAVSLFGIPESDPVVRPILETLPAQMISIALADLQGNEPGRFARASKVTLIE